MKMKSRSVLSRGRPLVADVGSAGGLEGGGQSRTDRNWRARSPLGRIASGVTAVGRYSGGPLDIALS